MTTYPARGLHLACLRINRADSASRRLPATRIAFMPPNQPGHDLESREGALRVLLAASDYVALLKLGFRTWTEVADGKKATVRQRAKDQRDIDARGRQAGGCVSSS